jgi:hypothetical protein
MVGNRSFFSLIGLIALFQLSIHSADHIQNVVSADLTEACYHCSYDYVTITSDITAFLTRYVVEKHTDKAPDLFLVKESKYFHSRAPPKV